MLWKLADALHKAEGPTHMAVVLDKGSTSFRNELYDQYKAQRPPAPEDLVPQFPMIRDAPRAFSLPCIEEAGFAADDLLARYNKEIGSAHVCTPVTNAQHVRRLLMEQKKNEHQRRIE